MPIVSERSAAAGAAVTEIDVLVAGAGVVGLATAVALAQAGRSVCVIETRPKAGMESSTHNSGVIHAGLYYPPGTLKARLSVQGREALYAFCEQHGVPHLRCGKLVVATSAAQLRELEALASIARGNGADVDVIDAARTRALEPHIAAAAALWSPGTGLVDASALVAALARLLHEAGGVLLTATRLMAVEATAEAMVAATERETIRTACLVNAAGLHADDVSAMAGGETFRIWPCRGDYAEILRSAGTVVSRPVYPLPDPSGHGLGVHFTPTIGGATLLGPTVRYQDSKADYESNRAPLEYFAESARLLAPDLDGEFLRPGGSGIRAKLHPPEERFADFMIRRDAQQPRLVHAAGIDSPGLTSCLAIGRMTAALASETL